MGGREYFAGDGDAMRVCFKAVTSEVTGDGREVTGNELTIEDGGARDANVEKVVETDAGKVEETDAGKVEESKKTKRTFSCSKCNKVLQSNQKLKLHESKCKTMGFTNFSKSV